MPKLSNTVLALVAAGAAMTSATAQDNRARPSFDASGVTHVPAFDLPASEFSSPEARAAQAARAGSTMSAPPANLDIAVIRQGMEAVLAPLVARMRAVHPVDVANRAFAGVPARIVTPKDKPFSRDRVLINVHGGAFSMCADACAMLESIPIAALGGYKVVTIDYRMAPEARHPAAVEDVEKVYRELLKSYKPEHIGLYGCSAGGALSGQAAAWMPAHGLPQFGAIGIFGAGAVPFFAGDSAYIAGYAEGSFPPPGAGDQLGDITQGYFTGSSPKDATAWPAIDPQALAKFPPTLIITGTRAMDMSPAIVTNSALIKARRASTLIVGEGMGHCYIYQPDLPEARDAHQAIVDFFKKNLGG